MMYIAVVIIDVEGGIKKKKMGSGMSSCEGWGRFRMWIS